MPDRYTKKFSHYEWDSKPPRKLSSGSFLDVREYSLRHCFMDGSHGPFYNIEVVRTPCLDAVVLVVFTRAPLTRVLLRHGTRPAAAVRARLTLPPNSDNSFPSIFWELPAGGVEACDWAHGPLEGLCHAAQREGWEETGINFSVADFFELGPAPFPAASYSPERLHFMGYELKDAITPAELPPGDGHPMEQGSWIKWVELDMALAWCKEGQIVDSKTELGIRRLKDYIDNAN